MKYFVRCSYPSCYLHTGAWLPDLVAAENLALAHERRMEDRESAHVVIVKESSSVQPSVEPQTGSISEVRHA